jgi:hypothetical protein
MLDEHLIRLLILYLDSTQTDTKIVWAISSVHSVDYWGIENFGSTLDDDDYVVW